jgi:hypothetical protein
VTGRIAAIHFQLRVRHDDSRAGFDMVPAQWRVIARVRDDRDVPRYFTGLPFAGDPKESGPSAWGRTEACPLGGHNADFGAAQMSGSWSRFLSAHIVPASDCLSWAGPLGAAFVRPRPSIPNP